MTEKQLIKLEAEKKRMYEMFSYEREYSDYEYICGIDEVGRGPFAGPVVACAVILPKDCDILYLNDSKKLSEKKREELFTEIKEKAVSYGIGIVSEKVIDEIMLLYYVITFRKITNCRQNCKYYVEGITGQWEQRVYGQKSTCRSLILTVPRKRITGA